MKKKTILVVDDTIANLDILTQLLADYDVIDVTNGVDALEVVEEEKIDLMLLDIMMPEMDGFEVCQRVKSNLSTKDIPVIFITAKTDEESIEKAYDIGGSDYVTKPFKPRELLARVKRELQLQDLQRELHLLASVDPMTQLYNRRYFLQASQHIFDLTLRDNNPLSLLMLDIDKFKKVNDTYGHQVGDDVIVTLAKILQSCTRESDIVSRWGGEEFLILLPETEREGAVMIAQKIRKRVENTSIEMSEKLIVKFTISLGVSVVDNSNDNSIEESINRADKALYSAKTSGRNQVC